jgi:hypothetical protein
MGNSTEALKMALEVNESMKDVLKQVNELIAENKLLKETLAVDKESLTTETQPEQEPAGEVGWLANVPNTIKEVYWKKGSPPIGSKLYILPPQRTWVGLTDEEIDSYFEDHGWSPSEYYYPAIKDIEAKLKERNDRRI